MVNSSWLLSSGSSESSWGIFKIVHYYSVGNALISVCLGAEETKLRS